MYLRALALCLATSAGMLAVDSIQYALPENGRYLMSLTSSEEMRADRIQTSRNWQMTGRVEVNKILTGYRITITYLTHYETVKGGASSGDLSGLVMVYELDALGQVKHTEGMEEVASRNTAALTGALPLEVRKKVAAAQRKALETNCEFVATALFGKPVRPGAQWKDVQIVPGMGTKPKPVTRDMKITGMVTCGIGECVAVEGTYQYNSAEDAAHTLEAVVAATGNDTVLPVEVTSSWDSARFRILVHPETGLVAGYREHVVGSTEVKSGTRSAKEERSRKVEFTLRNEVVSLAQPRKAKIIIP